MNTTLKQCPACRSPLPAMATKCDACGYEIQADAANKTVITLAEKFEAIEAELTESGLLGGRLEAELKARKGRVIRDFPVPNGREDLLSLLHYIAPRLDGGNADPNIEEWRAKFKEVTTLAKNSFKNNAKVREELEDIERSVQVSMTGELKNRAKRSPVIAIVIGVVILLVIAGLVSTQIQKHKVSQCEEQFEQNSTAEKARLDAIFAKATTELKEGNYSDALATNSTLRWDLRLDCKQDATTAASSQWDQKRAELEALIRSEESKQINEKKAAEDKKASEEKAAAEKAEAAAAATQKAEAAAAQKAEAAAAAAAAQKAAAAAAAASKAATAVRKATTDKEF